MATDLNDCPVCHLQDTLPWCTGRPLDYSLDQTFLIQKCTQCGHGRTRLEASGSLATLYEEGAYGAHEGAIQRLSKRFQIAQAYKFCRTIQTVAPGNHLLEFGAGKGAFLEGARRAGFEIRGLEPSRRSRGFADQLLGIGVVTEEPIERHEPPPGLQYDVICAWHVLEHLPDPEGTLARVFAMLRTNGVLYLGVPNFGSSQAVRGRGDWYHLDPPRHLHHFTESSLVTLLERQGFRIAAIQYKATVLDLMGEVFTLLNQISKSKNAILNFLKQNKLFFSTTKQNGRFTIILNFVMLPIIMPIALAHLGWDRLRHRSATFLIVAIKN